MPQNGAAASVTDRGVTRRSDSSAVQDEVVDEMQPSMLSHHDYTVGWVCTHSIERTAATIMLDEIHSNLPKSQGDRNTYTLGCIGKHNIVIACLPKGQKGLIPAAKVVTWMTGTFPSIRIGLMVGVGGGVPPKVKLGDVVISTPVAEYPGVIQWDMGKSEESGFRRTGSLNNPPTALLTATSKMETQHEIYGSKVAQYLEVVARRYPHLDPTYTQSHLTEDSHGVTRYPTLTPDDMQGILAIIWAALSPFISFLLGWFVVTSEVPECETIGVDTTDVSGKKREKTNEQLRVHYGIIASGNQVIKNATVRDRLDKELGGNLLCVDMEAAGLMNDFPCVVIRGIGNYADSHKNKRWQKYAATVAAGCAKELLGFIDPMDVKHTQEARRVIHMLHDISTATQDIAQMQEQQIQEQTHQIQEEGRPKLFESLSPLSPSVRHLAIQKHRIKNTGVWTLD